MDIELGGGFDMDDASIGMTGKITGGLSRRDFMAALNVHALLTTTTKIKDEHGNDPGILDQKKITYAAVRLADALIAELDKVKP